MRDATDDHRTSVPHLQAGVDDPRELELHVEVVAKHCDRHDSDAGSRRKRELGVLTERNAEDGRCAAGDRAEAHGQAPGKLHTVRGDTALLGKGAREGDLECDRRNLGLGLLGRGGSSKK